MGGKEKNAGVHDQLGQKRGGASERGDDGKRNRKTETPMEGRQEEEGAREAVRFCMCSGGGYPCAHRGEAREADPGAECRACVRWICMRCVTDEAGVRGSRYMCCSCAWRRRHEEMQEGTESEEEDSDELYWPSALERGACSDEPEEDEDEGETRAESEMGSDENVGSSYLQKTVNMKTKQETRGKDGRLRPEAEKRLLAVLCRDGIEASVGHPRRGFCQTWFAGPAEQCAPGLFRRQMA